MDSGGISQDGLCENEITLGSKKLDFNPRTFLSTIGKV